MSNINANTINVTNLNTQYINGVPVSKIVPGYYPCNLCGSESSCGCECAEPCDYTPGECDCYNPGPGCCSGGGGGGGTGQQGPPGPPGPTGPTGSFKPNGTLYGDYIYWNNQLEPPQWAIGSTDINLGGYAGEINQGTNAVALGYQAGQYNQGDYSVAIGYQAGLTGQNYECVAIGLYSGRENQQLYSVAIGSYSGEVNQGTGATGSSVAIGYFSGQTNQSANSVSIGNLSGNNSQGLNSVSIGAYSAQTNQGINCVAIGPTAGNLNQYLGSIAIGYLSGQTNQGSPTGTAIALGYQAGQTNQGAYALALGYQAGQTSQNNNSIILNAQSSSLDSDASNALFIAPIRSVTQSTVLGYNTTNKEITYYNFVGAPSITTFSTGVGLTVNFGNYYQGTVTQTVSSTTTISSYIFSNAVAGGQYTIAFSIDSGFTLTLNSLVSSTYRFSFASVSATGSGGTAFLVLTVLYDGTRYYLAGASFNN